MSVRDFPERMRREFADNGFRIVEPAQMPCLLPISDWYEDSFLAKKDDHVVISVIRARKKRNGAWRRLLALLKANRIATVSVIIPLPDMKAALLATGFSGPFVADRDGYEVWVKDLR